MKTQSQAKEKLQPQQIEQQSEVMMKVIQNYNDISKRNKNGLTRVAYCQYCEINHTQKKRIIIHKRTCKARLRMKGDKKLLNSIGSSTLSFIQRQQTYHIVKDNHAYIEQKQKKIGESPKYLSEIQRVNQSQTLANQIMNLTSDSLLQCIRVKLVQSISKAKLKGLDIQKTSLQIKLLSKMNSICLDGIATDEISILHSAKQRLSVEESQQTIRTQRSSEKAFEFFGAFTDFDLIYQGRIIYRLSRLSKSQVQQCYRYYKKLQRFSSQIPNLIQIKSELPWKAISQIYSFGRIIELIFSIANQNNLRLICDMWVYMCLGIKVSQLQKVKLLTRNGKGAMFVKLKEEQTNKTLIRYIPQSVIRLIKYCGCQYPMNTQRINQIRQSFYDLTREHFYSLRHLHSINIIQALHNCFGNEYFHSFKYTDGFLKINEQALQQIDNLFTFSFPFQQQLQQQQVMIDLINNQERYLGCFDMLISLDDNQSIMKGYQEDYIFKCLTPHIIQSVKTINFEQKEILSVKCIAYQQFKKQFTNKHLPSNRLHQLIYFFSSLLNDLKFAQHFIAALQSKGRMFTKGEILQTAAEFIDKSIVIIYFNNIEIHFPFSTTVYQPAKVLVIGCTSKGFLFTDYELNNEDKKQYFLIKQRMLAETSEVKNKFKLSNIQPECVKCISQKLLMDIDVRNRGYFTCPNCKSQFRQEYPTSPQIKASSVKFKSVNRLQLSISLNDMPVQKERNNLKLMVQSESIFKVYSTEVKYSVDLPDQILTNYSKFNPTSIKKIHKNRKNEQYLCLQVKDSGISIANKGVFTTTRIPTNTIILSYIGIIGSNFTTNIRHDSLFHLGWLSSLVPRQVLISTQFSSNAARYINSSDNQHAANCKVIIGLVEWQLAVVIVSQKEIAEGTQLFYQYGEYYWQSNQKMEREQAQQEEK